MTSSLVGSEMCIRDRPGPGSQPAFSTHLTNTQIRNQGRLHQTHPYVSRDCLLYTSDAADDM
eukprot:4407602-Prorocentrum_lima.AAC.1